MNRMQRTSLVVALVLAAVGLVLVAGTALADWSAPQAAPVDLVDLDAAPDLAGIDAANVMDPSEYVAVRDFTERVTPYISVGTDGMPRLADVGAEELGVDPTFLANFERAMEFSNQALRDAHIVVNPDLTLVVPRGVDAAPIDGVAAATDPGLVARGGTIGDRGAVPDWGAWGYPQGAMFFNSYEDYWQYYYNRYYVLCNSMAAYLGYPWLSGNLVYFYAYNGSYFNNSCYRGYGTYFFLPYSGGSGMYNPCWCGGLSYRPVYFWVRSYTYDYRCGCYGYTWNWQGYWARY